MGALQFVGAKLVSQLVLKDVDVQATASYEDVLHSDELLWYRQEQLQIHHGVVVKIANLTNRTQVEGILKWGSRKAPPSELIFVPPGVDGETFTKKVGEGVDHSIMEGYLTDFVTVLEVLSDISPCTRIFLISHSKQQTKCGKSSKNSEIKTMLLAWMQTFENVLATSHYLYSTPMTVIRISDLHGPWGREALNIYQGGRKLSNLYDVPDCKHWYVSNAVNMILEVVEQRVDCQVIELGHYSENSVYRVKDRSRFKKYSFDQQQNRQTTNLKKTLKWAASYRNERELSARKNADTVFTSYFTSTEDSQRKRKKSLSRFQYMAEFFWSLKKLNMRAVIFHDGLESGFQHRVTSHYSGVTFSQVKSLNDRSTNDARFYAYLKYLREHSEIDRVLLTDISDVVFQKDPFELMTLLGDKVYIGTDIDIFPNMRSMPWIKTRLRDCFGNYSMDTGDLGHLMDMNTVYNAGVIGGTRRTVLAILEMIKVYLDVSPPSLNCNMPAVNYAVHKYFFDNVFTGYPLNSRFLRWQAGPKGVYVVHK